MILPEEIEAIAFLQNLGEPYANQVASMMQLQEYAAGGVIFREGHESANIYFVLQGKVRLSINLGPHKSMTVQTLGPGELLGWSPVLGQKHMTATASAIQRCRLAALSVSQLMGLCEQDRHFGITFLRQLAISISERLAATRRRLSG